MAEQLARQADALSRVGKLDFERLIADHYRGLGYQAAEQAAGQQAQQPQTAAVPGDSAAPGMPLRLQRSGRQLLVLCRHGQPPPVDTVQVQTLLGMLEEAPSSTTAVLITASEFDEAALAMASGSDRLQLIDGDVLRAMIGPVPEPSGCRLPPPLPLTHVPASRRLARLRDGAPQLHTMLAAWGPRQWARLGVPVALLLMAGWAYPQYLAVQAHSAQQQAQALERRPVFATAATAPPEAAPAAKERLTGLWNPLPIRPAAENRPAPRPKQDPAPQPALVHLTESNVWTEQELHEWQRRQQESIRTLEGSDSGSSH